MLASSRIEVQQAGKTAPRYGAAEQKDSESTQAAILMERDGKTRVRSGCGGTMMDWERELRAGSLMMGQDLPAGVQLLVYTKDKAIPSYLRVCQCVCVCASE